MIKIELGHQHFHYLKFISTEKFNNFKILNGLKLEYSDKSTNSSEVSQLYYVAMFEKNCLLKSHFFITMSLGRTEVQISSARVGKLKLASRIRLFGPVCAAFSKTAEKNNLIGFGVLETVMWRDVSPWCGLPTPKEYTFQEILIKRKNFTDFTPQSSDKEERIL